MWVWWVFFDCLANVRWTNAYKQMAVEEVYLIMYNLRACELVKVTTFS